MTMKKSVWPVLAIVTMSLAIPASAQNSDENIPSGGLARNEVECLAQFRAADLNGDGFLSRREMSESRSLMPTELSGEDTIPRQEFLFVCNATAESQGGG